MIEANEFFVCSCDNCGQAFGNYDYDYLVMPDKISMENELGDSDEWFTERGNPNKHYCPECFTIDEEDNLIINKERANLQPKQ